MIPFGKVECSECRQHLAEDTNGSIVAACASVGIERNLPLRDVFTYYMTEYHERGHRG